MTTVIDRFEAAAGEHAEARVALRRAYVAMQEALEAICVLVADHGDDIQNALVANALELADPEKHA